MPPSPSTRIDTSTAPATADDAGDVFSAGCPARALLDLLASKWVLLLIHALAGGPARTGELRRRVEGISEKMLVQTLRELEAHGLLTRQDHGEVPPRVDYTLTATGQSLSKVVKQLDRWVQANAVDLQPTPVKPPRR